MPGYFLIWIKRVNSFHRALYKWAWQLPEVLISELLLSVVGQKPHHTCYRVFGVWLQLSIKVQLGYLRKCGIGLADSLKAIFICVV